VVPFSLRKEQLAGAFVVGGGYKYCQLGEGNCFLRVPADCTLRPVITGWFSEFEMLAAGEPATPVAYGPGTARFAGATYDPTSHYRAARVFDFFEEQKLTPELLRSVSQHQVDVLARAFDALDADPRVIARDRGVTLSELGGFLALRSPGAAELSRRLRQRDVWTDYRADVLRFGPAPYLSDAQLGDAMHALGSVIRELGVRRRIAPADDLVVRTHDHRPVPKHRGAHRNLSSRRRATRFFQRNLHAGRVGGGKDPPPGITHAPARPPPRQGSARTPDG